MGEAKLRKKLGIKDGFSPTHSSPGRRNDRPARMLWPAHMGTAVKGKCEMCGKHGLVTAGGKAGAVMVDGTPRRSAVSPTAGRCIRCA